MRIFISYGHNDYVELVDRLFDALREAGHEPWKDDRYEGASGIAPGEDFTEVIFKAIDESDFVIAFVSRATADKPYCRDERQYAYNRKGSHFIQIRLDGVDITLGNSRSYIDMSDVVSTTGEITERLFEDKMRSLFAAFRDPESFAEGGITPWTKIDTHLKVPGSLKYDEFVADLDDTDFVGREWLFEQCKAWAQDNTVERRLFVILGEAGTGKTAFVRHLASDAELVRSVHVCIYDRPSTRTAKDTLKDLAYVLAQNNPTYFAFLKSENLEKIKEMSIDGLFEYLFLEPLRTETGKYLLIIDGLDELEESNGLVPLMKLFRQYGDRINPNISFLLTTRPDEYIVEHLRKVSCGKPLDSVTLNKDASRADLSLYIERKLGELNSYSETLAAKILDACDGNFEYLSLLFKEAIEEGLSVSESMQMPRGLNERYAQYLDRRMEANELSRLTKEQRKLLAVMCATNEPIPLSLLSDITDMDENDVLDELELFGSLIRRSGDKRDPLMSVFTKSFRDFLVSMEYRRYSADKDAGNELIAEYVIENCKSDRDFAKFPYVDSAAFIHLLRYAVNEPERVKKYVGELMECGVDVALRVTAVLESADAELIDSYFENFYEGFDIGPSVQNGLKGRRAAEALLMIIDRHVAKGRISEAKLLEAEMLLWDPTPEVTAKAEKLCLEALELDRAAYAATPNYKTRRSLALSIEKVAKNYGADGTAEGRAKSESMFYELLELNRERYEERNDYRTRRDLSIAYNFLGKTMMLKETPEGRESARECFRKSAELCEQNYSERASNESRSDLAYIYGRLGALAEMKETADGFIEAEKWYDKSISLNEQICEENPCYLSRVNLAFAYGRLAKLGERIGVVAAFKQSREFSLKRLELYEQNYRENPDYSSRLNLALVYCDLADITEKLKGAAGLDEAESLYLKCLEISEQIFKDNPCFDTQRFVAVSCGRLGDVTRERGTRESLEKALKWYSRGREIDERNYRDNPSHSVRRDLAVSTGKVAQVKMLLNPQEFGEEAESMFRDAAKLYEQNYREDPLYQSRRDLAVALGHVAETLKRQNKTGCADELEEIYQRRIELYSKNFEETPCYASRRDLSVGHADMGTFLISGEGDETSDAAIKHFEQAVELEEYNYSDNPCSQSRINLCAALRRLAEAQKKQGTRDGMEKAAAVYHRTVEILDKCYESEKNYQNRRELACAAGVLAYTLKTMGTAEDLARAKDFYIMQYMLIEENYKEDPSDGSVDDLDVAARTLAGTLCAIGTDECLEQAKTAYVTCTQMRKIKYEKAPSYNSRNALSYCYGELCRLYQRSNDPEDINLAIALAQNKVKLDEQSFNENPCEQSKKNLLIDYQMIYYVLRKKGDEQSLAIAAAVAKCYEELKNS